MYQVKAKSPPTWLCLGCNKNYTSAKSDCSCHVPLIQVAGAWVKAGLVPGYLLEEEIGQGSSGTIYRGIAIDGDRQTVAIKVLHKQIADDFEMVMRFKREAELTSLIQSENMVKLKHAGILDDGRPFMVMELIDGYTGRFVTDKIGAMPVRRALAIFIQIANGLADIHASEIIHRDIKPSNIMISQKGDRDVVKIIDLGLGRMKYQSDNDPLNLTLRGDVVGSPAYMSPEQCQGLKLDGRSDIYSFGCLMYELLTGRTVFSDEADPVQTMKLQMEFRPLPMNLPQSPAVNMLELIVFKAMEKQTQNRQFCAAELSQHLQQCQTIMQEERR